jgi:predicted nuclease of predicted toxin-antitoxin system
MQFLANENFPLPSILFLRQEGYIVRSVTESYPGISDVQVIGKAESENSIILTFDKDYGEIIFKLGLKNPPAVIFFRFKGEEPVAAGKLLTDLLKSQKLIVEKKFTVIEKGGIRQRSY